MTANPLYPGRGETIRTSDHLIPNQVRYQAALRPEEDAHNIGSKDKGQSISAI
jgi:hypothetical protein